MLFNLSRAMKQLTLTSQTLFSKTPQFMQTVSPAFLLNEDPKPRKKTKTVCTIG